jgi:hypothetical protein
MAYASLSAAEQRVDQLAWRFLIVWGSARNAAAPNTTGCDIDLAGWYNHR